MFAETWPTDKDNVLSCGGVLPCVSNIVILRSFKEYRVDALNVAPCDKNSASYKGGCKLKNTLHMAQES